MKSQDEDDVFKRLITLSEEYLDFMAVDYVRGLMRICEQKGIDPVEFVRSTMKKLDAEKNKNTTDGEE